MTGEVRNLNLWGNDYSDVSIVRRLPNVEVISLSVNSIATLRDFAGCQRLAELYLRKNAIGDLAELGFLRALPNLKVLWLCDNPCAGHALYRPLIVRLLPGHFFRGSFTWSVLDWFLDRWGL